MKNLLKIENDCFFIAQRLKQVDPTYEIYFNLNSGAYEVHSNGQSKSSYCFKVPYNVLDERTIDFAYKTRIQNLNTILNEIDKENRILQEKMLKQQMNLFMEALCE